MLTNNKKDVTVKVNDIKSIKSIQKKINENGEFEYTYSEKEHDKIINNQKALDKVLEALGK